MVSGRGTRRMHQGGSGSAFPTRLDPWPALWRLCEPSARVRPLTSDAFIRALTLSKLRGHSVPSAYSSSCEWRGGGSETFSSSAYSPMRVRTGEGTSAETAHGLRRSKLFLTISENFSGFCSRAFINLRTKNCDFREFFSSKLLELSDLGF